MVMMLLFGCRFVIGKGGSSEDSRLLRKTDDGLQNSTAVFDKIFVEINKAEKLVNLHDCTGWM